MIPLPLNRPSHPAFIYYEKEPLNGAPPPFLARGEFITPFDLFYIRSHGNIPELDAANYQLRVQGFVSTPLKLSLEELKARFSRSSGGRHASVRWQPAR